MKRRAKKTTVEPPTLSERLVIAMERIETALERAHAPIITGSMKAEIHPGECANCMHGCTFIGQSRFCDCVCHQFFKKKRR